MLPVLPLTARAVLAGALLGAAAASARAQSAAPRNAASVVGGTYNSDIDSDDYLPFAAVRLERVLGRWAVAEAGAGFTPGATRLDSDGRDAGGQLIRPREVRAALAALEVQLQAQLPLGRARPYVGAGAGLFGNLRGTRDTEAFVRPTVSAAGGLRVDATPRLGLRAELRARRNTYRFQSSTLGAYTSAVYDVEQTAGVAWRF